MKLKLIATVAVLGIAAFSSSNASAQETVEHEVIRPNRPLLIAGLATVAATYTPAVVVAATSDHKGDDKLYYPVAGPWWDLAERGGCAPNSCEQEALYKGLLIAGGTAHIVGAGLLVASLIVPEEHLRVNASTKPMVLPAQMGKAGAGLTVVGSF